MQNDLTLCDGEDCPFRMNCLRFCLTPLGRQDFFGQIPLNRNKNSCEYLVLCYRLKTLFLRELKINNDKIVLSEKQAQIIIPFEDNLHKYDVLYGEIYEWHTDWGVTYQYLNANLNTQIKFKEEIVWEIKPGIYSIHSIQNIQLKRENI